MNLTQLRNIAQQYGTPCYVYDQARILERISNYQNAFGETSHTICYAVKANDNLSILRLMHEQGLGFDVVSGGELEKVMLAAAESGDKPRKVIFSGVGKTIEEIEYALEVGIDAFDVESLPELDRIAHLARKQNVIAPISIRFNPNIDAKTHPYISTGMRENKFGLDADNAMRALRKVNDHDALELVGINMHIGSQITDMSAFKDALCEQSRFIDECLAKGYKFEHINCGGGLGLASDTATEVQNINVLVREICTLYPQQHIIIEPGRSIIARAGYLLMTVQYVKAQAGQTFAIVDAGMNDYMRVALYGVEHELFNLCQSDSEVLTSDDVLQVVGPVCESGDFFNKQAKIRVKAGDVLAMRDVGAYGASMGSTYNARPRPPEVLVDNGKAVLIKPREDLQVMIQAELMCLREQK